MIKRVRQDLQDTQEEHDEEDLQKEYEKPHWSSARKKTGPKQDEGIKERFPDGKVSCASIYYPCILMIFFQCALCDKSIKPPTGAEFRRHLKHIHHEGEDFCKCSHDQCNYVSCYPLNTFDLSLQGTAKKTDMRRHVRQVHAGLDRMNCPCCGINLLR